MEENSEITYSISVDSVSFADVDTDDTLTEDDIDKVLLEFINEYTSWTCEATSLSDHDKTCALHALLEISGAMYFASLLKTKIRGEEE